MRRVIGIALAAGAVAVLGWLLFFKAGTSATAADTAKGKGHRGGDGPVPVSIADIARRDLPIYLDGLGTVQAFNTVTVRPQVDGQLVTVAFREGQEVKAGDLLAQIDPRSYQSQLDQALAKKAQDASLLANAKRDLDRYEGLVGDGYVSKQQLDTQKQQVTQLEATVKADEAAAQNARIALGYARVTSPISGVTGLRLVDVGNLVTAATTGGLVVVTQVRPISVVFTLPEQTLSDIREAGGGQGLKVLALDRDNRKPLADGTLTVIDNQIDQTTGTIKLKATFANGDKALWPGQFVNVRLLVRTEKNGIVIPQSAVQRGPDGDFVYVAKGDAAEKHEVTVARTEDGVALIAKGLADGDRIVTDGQYRLQPGSKIRAAGAPALAAVPRPQ
ncbi:MAG: efflux RND transporter periplasmic adaptor subunit [Nevskia sp.]